MDIEQYLKRFHAFSFKEVSLDNLGETSKPTFTAHTF